MSTAIECFDAFIRNPTMETADEYLQIVQAEADDYYLTDGKGVLSCVPRRIPGISRDSARRKDNFRCRF